MADQKEENGKVPNKYRITLPFEERLLEKITILKGE